MNTTQKQDPAIAFYQNHDIKEHAKQTCNMDRLLAVRFGVDVKAINERNNPFNYRTHRKAYKKWQAAYLKELVISAERYQGYNLPKENRAKK